MTNGRDVPESGNEARLHQRFCLTLTSFGVKCQSWDGVRTEALKPSQASQGARGNMWRLLGREAGCLVMSLRGATIDGYGSTRYVVRYKGAD